MVIGNGAQQLQGDWVALVLQPRQQLELLLTVADQVVYMLAKGLDQGIALALALIMGDQRCQQQQDRQRCHHHHPGPHPTV